MEQGPFHIELNNREDWFIITRAPGHVTRVRVHAGSEKIDAQIPEDLGRRVRAPLACLSEDNLLIETFMDPLPEDIFQSILLEQFPIPLGLVDV